MAAAPVERDVLELFAEEDVEEDSRALPEEDEVGAIQGLEFEFEFDGRMRGKAEMEERKDVEIASLLSLSREVVSRGENNMLQAKPWKEVKKVASSFFCFISIYLLFYFDVESRKVTGKASVSILISNLLAFSLCFKL